MFQESGVEAARVAAEAARYTAIFALVGAVIAAAVSVTVALMNNRAARENERKLQELRGHTDRKLQVLKERGDRKLARLNASIQREQAEQDARRDYLYEARKRLYKECGPLLFRLSEASENALHRVYSLARAARDGDLNPGRNWLAGPGYYLTSTLYNLLAPCAVFRLLQERLTLVDLEVDGLIKDQYLLAKWVYVSFTDDFSLAQTEPVVPYTPFEQAAPAERCRHPARYRRQGVPIGMLERAVEGLVKTGAGGAQTLLTYGEFEAALAADLAGRGARYGVFAEVFDEFHPRTRPVLWRILVAQALLHRELLRVFRTRTSSNRDMASLAHVPREEFELLAWSTSKDPAVVSVMRRPFDAASHYFATHLPVLFDALRRPPRELSEGVEPAAAVHTAS
jgi:hypothetical protein